MVADGTARTGQLRGAARVRGERSREPLTNIAVYAQYIVPWVLIVGMLTSVLRRATRAQLEPLEGDCPEEPHLDEPVDGLPEVQRN